MKLSDWFTITRAPNMREAYRALLRQGKDRKLAAGMVAWVAKRLRERERKAKA